MDALTPPMLQPQNMSSLPSMPGYNAPPVPAEVEVPPGVDPAQWFQLPPETRMHYMNMLKGMQSAQPGVPSYGPPPQPTAPISF